MKIFPLFEQLVTFLNSSLYKYSPAYMAQQTQPGNFSKLFRRDLSPYRGKISFVFLWEFSDYVPVRSVYSLLTLC